MTTQQLTDGGIVLAAVLACGLVGLGESAVKRWLARRRPPEVRVCPCGDQRCAYFARRRG